MTLSDHQWEFLKDVSLLIIWADQNGFKLTGGELERTIYQQQKYFDDGLSKTLNSNHLKRLAIDLNIFSDIDFDGDMDFTYNMAIVKPLGDYWESLSTYNRWGGNFKSFKDIPHFERHIG